MTANSVVATDTTPSGSGMFILRGDPALLQLAPKASVRIATQAAIANLSSVSVSQDGVTLVQNDRVLVLNGASPDGIVAVSNAYNGLYNVGTVAAGLAPFVRSADANTAAGLAGMSAFVSQGTVGRGGY